MNESLQVDSDSVRVEPVSTTNRTDRGPAAAGRVASIDAYRGLAVFLMMSEALRLCDVANAVPDSRFWGFLCAQLSHVEWRGCALHDLIQPSFMFLVGVALPFSIASRKARGQSSVKMSIHAFRRSLILILLGMVLLRIGQPETNLPLIETLTQIGLGYGLLYLIALRPPRDRWIVLAVLLIGYWAAYALYPLPGPGFDYARVGVSGDWLAQHGLHGFAAHWNKNSNLGWRFDVWFHNLFPREHPFLESSGGYATLDFISSLGTMILGLMAGETLRGARTAWSKVRWLVVAGVLALAFGFALDRLGICPIIKRLTTTSFVIFSAGWCFLALAGFYAVMDIWKKRVWAFPLTIVGINPITAYCANEVFVRHFTVLSDGKVGFRVFSVFGAAYSPAVLGASLVILVWLALLVMYRRKIFIRI